MKRYVLLVDDEEILLESLKEGLGDIPDLEVDTAGNVDSALELVSKNSYQLIITDIRMPGKSGIDLVMELQKRKVRSGIMIMTAYGNQETFDTVSRLGGLNIISKPFDIDWFRQMLQNFLDQKGVAGQIDAIELPSLLQIVNLEKKSAEVEIEIDRRKGSIYFQEGELIHAEFADLQGEEAAIRLILMGRGYFHLKPLLKKVPRTILTPFLPFLLNLMKNEDERNKSFLKVSQQSHLSYRIKNRLKEILEELRGITGYLGSAIITATGQLLEGDLKAAETDFTSTTISLAQLLDRSREIVEGIASTPGLTLQIETEKLLIILSCLQESQIHLHLILLLSPESNLASAKLKLKKISDTILEFSNQEKLHLQ